MEIQTTRLPEASNSSFHPTQQLTTFHVPTQLVHIEAPIIRRKRHHSANYDSSYNLQSVLFSKASSKERSTTQISRVEETPSENATESKTPNELSGLIVPEGVGKHDEKSNDIEIENGTTKNIAASKGRLNFCQLPRRKKCIIILCTLTYFMEGCGFSLLAPFFPQEAHSKGMSPTLTGFVFSIFELMIFLTSPIFGSYLTQLGPKFVVLAGVFVAGICNILFGTLDLCPSGTSFIVISIMVRSVEALGFSAYVTALMAIVISEFPKDVTTTFAILETANGVGMMVGPAIGGALYQLGGFGLPFYVIGLCILINGLLVYFVIPQPQNTVPGKSLPRSKLSILGNPMVLIAIFSICVGCLGESFLDPTLANHLERFELSVVVIGLFFVIGPLAYTMFSPVWGYLTDRKGLYRELLVIGQLLYGFGFLFIGPSKLLPFLPYELWTIVVGLVLQGSFFGCCLIPTMKCMLIGALEVGFEESIETFAVVSGLLNSMYSLGAFLGPLIGGVLVEQVSASMAYTIVGLASMAMGFISLIFFMGRRSKRSEKCKEGYEPLA